MIEHIDGAEGWGEQVVYVWYAQCRFGTGQYSKDPRLDGDRANACMQFWRRRAGRGWAGFIGGRENVGRYKIATNSLGQMATRQRILCVVK